MRRWFPGLLVACVGPATGPDVDATEPAAVGWETAGVAAAPVGAGSDAPPSDWGAGLVELVPPPSGRALVVDPGDRSVGRPAEPTVVFVADLDGDGLDEVATATTLHDARRTAWSARVLRWTDAGLVDDDALGASLEAGGVRAGGPDAPLGALDLDGDGLVDLLGGTPEAAVRWGVAPGEFGPWVDLSGDRTGRHGMAVGLADLDVDGWLDLILGSEICDAAGFAALRTGPRSFELHPEVLDGPAAMARAFLPVTFADGGRMLFVVDDADACAPDDPRPRFARAVDDPDDLVPRYVAYDPMPPDAWWKKTPQYAGQLLRRLAPMGAGVDDLDGDGHLDLVVTTGISEQAVLGGLGEGRFEAASGDRYVRPVAFDRPELPWSVGFPDLDLDGRGDVVFTIGDDATSFLVDQGHPMRNAVAWNAGGLHLEDVEDASGPAAQGSWHALALADPDRDGDADMAFGGDGRPPAVFRNDVDVEGRRGVTLRLVGTTSNRQAIGARVEARLAGGPRRTTLVGGVGNRLGTSEPLVFLGAGDAEALDEVRITWPSGLVQVLHDVAVGALHTVVEPATIEVLAPDRRGVADGDDPVLVVITPRTDDGRIDASARVEVAFHGIPPAVVERPALADGTRVLELRSDAAGVTVVEVHVDGVPIRVRPKVWWDAPPAP